LEPEPRRYEGVVIEEDGLSEERVFERDEGKAFCFRRIK
jgi:hypothetical protein